MNPLLRGAQNLMDAVWRATHRAEKAHPAGSYPAVAGSGGWINIIREPFTGAWQRNLEINTNTVLTNPIVFACISLISGDFSKLRVLLVQQNANGIWNEVEANSPFWPVLRKPNRYQTRIQFFANWAESKLIHGNCYVLKARDGRGVVNALYILDPSRVTVLLAPDGSVYYQLRSDDLTGVHGDLVTVPASEIIHDRWNTYFHPLIGIPPLTAAGMPATQGLTIQENQTKLFANGAMPGGILSAPGKINDDTARRLKEYWDTNYGAGGPNVGKVAVLGDDLKYMPMMMTSVDAQTTEQLKATAELICSVFHVPAYKVGVAPAPTYNNIEALNQAYYSDCLQKLIEQAENVLDEGLELPKPFGTWFDTETGLFRMDTASRVKAAADAIGSGAMAPNEARFRYFDLGPVKGGESPYLQQQQFSLSALAERDRDKPFSKPEPAAPATPAEGPANGDSADDTDDRGEDDGVAARAFLVSDFLRRSQAHYVGDS